VLSITGLDPEAWAAPEAERPAAKQDDRPPDCLGLVALLKLPGQDLGPAMATAHGPWGVQVAGSFSRARVMRSYARLQEEYPGLIGDKPPMVIGSRMRGRGTRIFYRVRVPMQSRKEADDLCGEIRSAGGSCIVLKT
jgi:hypothetical protein